MLKKLAWAVTLTLAATALPIRLKLDQPFSQQVKLDADKSVMLVFQGKESLEVRFGAKSHQLPLESVASETMPEARGEVLVEDFDFDGRKDVAVPTGIGYGGVNVFYQVYRLNEQLEPFPRDWALCNPEFSYADKTVLSNSRSGPFWYGTDYRFQKGRPWVWRKRLPVTLGDDLLTLFEVYEPQGKLISARLSASPSELLPATLKLSSPAAVFLQPGSRGTRGMLKSGKTVTLDLVQEWSQRAYARVAGQGWILLPQEAIHR